MSDEDSIPVEIISTEEREDGVYVTARMPDGENGITRMMTDDISVVSAEEHNYPDMIIEDGDSLIAEHKLPRDTPKNLRGRNIMRMFDEYPKVTTHRGPSRDRSLSGKARRKARKAE